MIELKILSSIYKEKIIDEEIHEVLYKKDVVSLKMIDPNDITSVQQVLTDHAKPYKNRCMVHIQGEGHMIIKHKYEDIKQLKLKNGGDRAIGYKST